MSETKASRLRTLSESGLRDNVLSQIVIQKSDFAMNPAEIVHAVISALGPGPFAVRSSADDEDQDESMAGKYLSLLDVPAKDLGKGIRSVFESYGLGAQSDQVLIQPFQGDSIASGVVFTVEPNLGSRYWTINWVTGNDTTAITSGAQNGHSLILFEGTTPRNFDYEGIRVHELLDLVSKVGEIFADRGLDIEWAQTATSTFILQVRPLAHAKKIASDSLISFELDSLKSRIDSLQQPHPYLAGGSTIFGVMPDWNPAELIGIRPNNLAFSLFRELISDSIWAYERGNLGYRNLRSFPLVLDFAGHPFVDLRISLNSLIPSDIPDVLAAKLVDYYLGRLIDRPDLHDKIEFEVVLSCFAFDWDETEGPLREFLSSEELDQIRASLLTLTKNVVLGEPYGLRHILHKQSSLAKKFHAIDKGGLSPIARAYWFVEDCKRNGTLPFAGVARLAFIATRLLGSLVQSKIVSEDELFAFTSGLDTRTSQMVRDQETLSTQEFVDLYGHLRPGTFDITVPNYANALDTYFPTLGKGTGSPIMQDKSLLTASFLSKVKEFLPKSELAISGDQLIEFCSDAIRAREESKFLFSRHVSAALESIAEVADSLGFSRAEASHIKIQTIQDAYKNPDGLRSRIEQDIQSGIRRESISHSISLPTLIRSPEEVICFEVSEVGANFVTLLSITGELVKLESPSQDISGKIVVIESADPGFDWIFTRGIVGLVTAWGGANSHMSIRAKELQIPSAIGVGEKMYISLSTSHSCRIDCRNKTIEILS